MVPAMAHLGDGRLLQEFFQGNLISGVAQTLKELAAQNEAVALASAAKKRLAFVGARNLSGTHPTKLALILVSLTFFLIKREN